MFINKEQYSQFELDIGNNFYLPQKSHTNLLPTNGKPAILKNQKVTLNLDFINSHGHSCSQLVQQKKISHLPEVSYLSLFHLGNQQLEGVKFGYDSHKKIFIFPGCDFGGLTNYRQPLGETSKLSKTGIKISKDSSVSQIIDTLYQQWKKLSKKERFYGQIKERLRLFLASAIKYLNSKNQFQSAIIKFWKLPSIHRVVYTSEDIENSLGKYYTRVYGQGDHHYAKKTSPHKDLYCSVWKPEWETNQIRITPNVNKNNLLNEFQTY